MKKILRHPSWMALMMKVEDGLPPKTKRIHQVIISLVVLLTLMPAVKVHAQEAEAYTQATTYYDGLKQLFTFRGNSYEITYTNLNSKVNEIRLNVSSDIWLLFIDNIVSNLYPDKNFDNGNKFNKDRLPTTLGQSVPIYLDPKYNGDILVDTNQPMGSIELVARLSFNANGGSGTMDDMASDATARKLTKNSFTKLGYSFAGWATTATGAKAYADEASYSGTSDATLYALWTVNNYAVTLDDQSATTSGQGSVTATYDSDMPKLTTLPKKTDYTFGGYYSETNGGGTKYYNADGTSAATWNVAAATTLYAKWYKDLVVTITPNKGYEVTTQTVRYGETFTRPADPIYKGCKFVGWYTNEYLTGAEYDFSKPLTSDLSIYGKWETLPRFEVTFNTNGGSYVLSQVVISGDKVVVPTPPTKTGYEFVGWYNDNTLTNVFDFANTTITAATILYASWKPIEYTITYILDGGTQSTSTPITSYTINSSNITLVAPTKPHNTFAGWTGTDLSEPTTDVNILSGSTGNRTYTATWTLCSYTVTFNTNGGSDVQSEKLVYGEKATVPATIPTKTGYTFVTWYGDNACTNVYDFTNTEITGDTTLYAKWTPYTYVIKFHSNDGSTDNTTTQTVTYDEETALTSNTFHKERFGFLKWTTSADGTGTSYTNGQKVINLSDVNGAVIELYAQWQEGINYVDAKFADGKVTTSPAYCDNYTIVTDANTTMSDGWYLVNSDVTISNRISLSGTVNLILADGHTLTASYGIKCGEGCTLNIYGQTNETGALKANASSYTEAAIGANMTGDNCGTITINGGVITASGENSGPGIGSFNRSGNITINYGVVNATGTSTNGIGASSGNLTINGGVVNATGGGSSVGIGTGRYDIGATLNIVINGGTVIANGDKGIGIGYTLNGNGIKLYVNGGNIKATTNLSPTTDASHGSKSVNCITLSSIEDATAWIEKVTTYNYNMSDVTAIDGKYYVWLPFYTITWKNNDGNTLRTDEYVEYGSTISYTGETPVPTIPGIKGSFKEWYPTITTVTCNATYTATYDNMALTLPTRIIDGITYYEIASEPDMYAFATVINQGKPSLNGFMTADINLGSKQYMI